MKNRDFVSSIIFTVLGIIFCSGGIKYKLSHLGGPGAGLFPFLFGLVLIGLSVILFIFSIPGFKKPSEKFFPQKDSFWKILMALLGILIYIIALPHAGFLLITFFFVVFMLRFIEPTNWISTILAASLATVVSFLLFEHWLGVQLPKGFWRI
jgi:putative tricarboxylic transport membrane protein